MFITFEGIEGSGKSSALDRLCDRLAGRGNAYIRTREPGGSLLGRELRPILLDARRSICPEAELFLYLADRAQHVNDVIRPALAALIPVLSDRYADSTIVYQGYGRGLDIETLFRFNDTAVNGRWPDMTLLFDVAPEEGLRRAKGRNAEAGTTVSEGRFEAEAIEFHRRIREGYLAWAEGHPQRFHIIDASVPQDEVFRQVLEIAGPALRL